MLLLDRELILRRSQHPQWWEDNFCKDQQLLRQAEAHRIGLCELIRAIEGRAASSSIWCGGIIQEIPEDSRVSRVNATPNIWGYWIPMESSSKKKIVCFLFASHGLSHWQHNISTSEHRYHPLPYNEEKSAFGSMQRNPSPTGNPASGQYWISAH